MYLGLQSHVLTFCIEKGKPMNGMQYFVIRRFVHHTDDNKVVAFHSRESWDLKQWVVPVPKKMVYKDFEGLG